MPETDEICALHPAKRLLPLWALILPRLPTTIPPIPPGSPGQTHTTELYDGPSMINLLCTINSVLLAAVLWH